MSQTLTLGAPTTADQSDGGQNYTLGCETVNDAAVVYEGARWLAPTNAPGGQCRVCLFRVSDMVKLAESNLFTATPGVNNDVLFTASYLAAVNEPVVTGVVTDRYAFKNPSGFPYTTGNVTAPATAGVVKNGRFGTTTAGVSVFPSSVSASNFMVSPIWSVAASAMDWTPVTMTLSGVAWTVTPGMITIPWTPVPVTLTPNAFAAVTPGMVTTPWTPVEITLQARPWGFDGGPGILATSGRSPSTLTASGRGRL